MSSDKPHDRRLSRERQAVSEPMETDRTVTTPDSSEASERPAAETAEQSVTIESIVARAPVIPVLVVDDLQRALPLARALCAGGLAVLEITLRTPVALEAIALIHREVPRAIVGAGTVLTTRDLERATGAGAAFIVSPGATARLIDAAQACGANFLPGVATPSEAMNLLDRGFSHLKFFPAEAAGGVPMLKSLYGPLPQLKFCPTGGINPERARRYLALPNVVCVGGSWMAPPELVVAENWREIESRAAAAAGLSASLTPPPPQ